MTREKQLTLQLSAKPRTKQEMAYLLQISYSTLLRRIKTAGIIHRPNLLLPTEQESILALFGFTVDWVLADDVNV